MNAKEGTKTRALREARGLLQTYGFNGFSFQHVANLLGIKKPSLYDHFTSKEALGQSLIDDYQTTLTHWIETVEGFGPKEKLGGLFDVFYKFSCDKGKLCPLSALIADFHSLPKSLKKPLSKLFKLQFSWLEAVIREGQKSRVFRNDSSASELAHMAISLGLGSQLVARVASEPEQIKEMKRQVFRILENANPNFR